MENASKALIIAGSILVAIMIVAMGVRIFNGARNSADTTALDSTEITMFNQKFERFSGTQKGSNVKSLLSFAISNASTNKDEPSKLPKIVLYYNKNNGIYANNIPAEQSNIDSIGSIREQIITTHTYEVNIDYSTSSGLITEITIKE